ncbi:MAG: MAPEG family protein [Sandaracinaceae bacterium]
MPIPLLCLLGFVAWTVLVVVFGLGVTRVGAVLRGEAKPNAFPADVPHGTDRYRRTMRAHANCVENLPLFAAVVLTAAVTDVTSSTLDILAMVYLGARIAQTIAHIASGSSLVVNIRFSFFAVQLLALAAMIGLIANELFAR